MLRAQGSINDMPCSIFLQSASVAFTQTQWLVIESSELLISVKKFILITNAFQRENMKPQWLMQELKRKSLDESCNWISNYVSNLCHPEQQQQKPTARRGMPGVYMAGIGC